MKILVVVIFDRLVVIEEARERICLPQQLADPEIRVQDGTAVQGFAAVEEAIQVELDGLADTVTFRAHALRRVEREGKAGTDVWLPGTREEQPE